MKFMKRLRLCTMLMALLGTQLVLADCNPRTIKKQASGDYLYPKACHLDYGRLRQVEEARKVQIDQLKKSIELKDLAISKSNERIELWQNATYKVEDRLLKVERNTERMRWFYLGLGVVITGAAVWGAGQLK